MLRDARGARRLTLDDIARTTKIGKATLIALEGSDVLRLPAAIYTRGFVKAYATEVGLDPDRTAEEYLRRIEPLTTHHLLVDDGQLPPLASTSRGVKVNDSRQLLAVNQVRRFRWLTTAGAVIGLGVYLVSFNRQAEEHSAASPAPAAAVDVAPASTSTAAATTTTPHPPEAVTATFTGPLQIELHPQGPCWLVATVDGERVLARLLQPGERETLAISEEAVLRIGDPGALLITINGHSGRTLGRPGQPVNVTITKDNFKEFLSS
jgi:cytoskeletal protein RodZ